MPTYTVSFRVRGDDLDPEEVSLLLGLQPEEAHRRGDPNVGAKGARFANFSTGVWLLRSPLAPEEELEDHLKHMVAKLEGREDGLRELRRQGHRLDFFIGVFGVGGNSGFVLSPELLTAIGRLGIDLDFDLYYY